MINNQSFSFILEISESFNSGINNLIQKDLGIDIHDYLILRALYTLTNETPNESVKQELIVKQLGFDKSTISRRFKKHEKLGYIKRKINKKSEREKLVSIREEGIVIIHSAEQLFNEKVNLIMSNLETYDQKQLQIFLLSIATSLSKAFK